MNAQQFIQIARKTAAKVFKSQFFHSIEIDSKNMIIRYKDCYDNLYTWQTTSDNIAGFFTIGKVYTWTERKLTYESEYTSMGDVDVTRYVLSFIQHTDSPDYILRASLSYLLPTV